MGLAKQIELILKERFKPEFLEVINESYKHAGHMGDDKSGESHFKIIISAKDVRGSSRLEKHREINNALKKLMPTIHALQIELKSS